MITIEKGDLRWWVFPPTPGNTYPVFNAVGSAMEAEHDDAEMIVVQEFSGRTWDIAGFLPATEGTRSQLDQYGARRVDAPYGWAKML